MSKCRISFNWYKVLYQTGDQKLISYFWRWYNSHKVKSKKRAARCVLIKYYSTTPAPDFVLDCMSFNHDARLARINSYE